MLGLNLEGDYKVGSTEEKLRLGFVFNGSCPFLFFPLKQFQLYLTIIIEIMYILIIIRKYSAIMKSNSNMDDQQSNTVSLQKA